MPERIRPGRSRGDHRQRMLRRGPKCTECRSTAHARRNGVDARRASREVSALRPGESVPWVLPNAGLHLPGVREFGHGAATAALIKATIHEQRITVNVPMPSNGQLMTNLRLRGTFVLMI